MQSAVQHYGVSYYTYVGMVKNKTFNIVQIIKFSAKVRNQGLKIMRLISSYHYQFVSIILQHIFYRPMIWVLIHVILIA